MCEPVTLAIAAGATVAGGIYKGYAARQAGYEQAAILEGNALTADYAAGDAEARGAQAEGKVRLEGGQKAAHQSSQLAASGVDVQSGSAVDVVADTGMFTELDAAIARSNGRREAWGYREQGKQFRRQASLQRSSADAALIAGIFGGVAGAASYAGPSLRVK